MTISIDTFTLSSAVTLNVLVNDKPIKQYEFKNNTFVEGRKNSNYSIRVKNNNYTRILAVISVDGLNICDGMPAGENSQGWIINGNSELVVPGWLVDDKAAAKFKFSAKDNSYAGKSGNDADNIGVIGCMIFKEKIKETVEPINIINNYPWWNTQPIQPYYPIYVYDGHKNTDHIPLMNNVSYGISGASCTSMLRGSADTFVSSSYTANGNSANETLGTEFGAKTDFKTTSATFDRAELIKTVVIYYKTKKELEKIGIIFEEKVKNTIEPNPFPASKNFCNPPKGWK